MKTDEARMERARVAREELRRVPLGVDGDEHALHARRVRPQLPHRLGDRAKRGRTDVRTVREAEKDHDRLAAEIGERAPLARRVVQREIAAELGTGDVGVAELGRAGRAGAERRGRGEDGEDAAHQRR